MTSETTGESGRGGPEPVLMKLSEVRRDTGIAVESLRLLIEDEVLVRGVERARNGHLYLRSDHVPTYEQLLAMLHRQLRAYLERARDQMRRVEVEMEAVRNDLAMALEDRRRRWGTT